MSERSSGACVSPHGSGNTPAPARRATQNSAFCGEYLNAYATGWLSRIMSGQFCSDYVGVLATIVADAVSRSRDKFVASGLRIWLGRAAVKGNLAQVEYLLDVACPLYRITPSSDALVSVETVAAARRGHLAVVQKLVEHCGRHGFRCGRMLPAALRAKHMDVAWFLVRQRVAPVGPDFVLRAAAQAGCLELVKHAVDALRADPTSSENYALRTAVRVGALPVVRYLFEGLPAPLVVSPPQGLPNPLLGACLYNRFQMARYLLEEVPSHSHWRVRLTTTAVRYAAQEGNFLLLRYVMFHSTAAATQELVDTVVHVADRDGDRRPSSRELQQATKCVVLREQARLAVARLRQPLLALQALVQRGRAQHVCVATDHARHSDGSSHDGNSRDGSNHDGSNHDGSSHDGSNDDGRRDTSACVNKRCRRL